MFSHRLRDHFLHLMLVVLMTSPSCALLDDGMDEVSLTPFQLTYTPAHVVQDVTEDVTVRCEHDGRGQSQLAEISRIRMSKRSYSQWVLLAELRDNEATPKVHIDANVNAKIDRNIRDTFLEIKWPLASQDIFGTYKCDLIGFDRTSFNGAGETTTELALLAENVTNKDMMDMFKETKNELSTIEEHEDRLDGNMTSLTAMMAVLTGKLDSLSSEQASLGHKLDSFMEITNSKLETLFSPHLGWPTGPFALLKPSTGCPGWEDLSIGNYKVHTESSSGPGNGNRHTSALPNSTISVEDSQNMMTLEFCQTGWTSSSIAWPQGSYCIHCINCRPNENKCPGDFKSGYVDPDLENTNLIYDNSGSSVEYATAVYFCCKSSGSASTPIVLPTERPFLLYRRGGQCQEVQGMDVSQETLQIDTEDRGNNDSESSESPDVDLNRVDPLTFHLCYYYSNA